MARVLYITHTGMAEPLGASQVLAYLRNLAKEHSISLISFEKLADFADAAKMAAIKAECDAMGIQWVPCRFRQSPRYFSSVINIAVLFWQARKLQRQTSAQIIHARAYFPALVAGWVGRMTGASVIFDMRALWVEELITAGRVQRNGLVHRALRAVEKRCLSRASYIISLTQSAVDYLRETYPSEISGKPISVIPTCVDLDRFPLVAERHKTARVIGCVGTIISGFFRRDLLAGFFSGAEKKWPDARFEIVSRDDPDAVTAALAEHGFTSDKLKIRAANPAEMGAVHAGHSVSAMFFDPSAGKRGSSPTRLGEALACGTPVVTNAGVGDVAEIAKSAPGLVLLEEETDAGFEKALVALEPLMHAPEVARATRAFCEDYYALEKGVTEINRIYDSLID